MLHNWTIVVDHVPGSSWEAYIEKEEGELVTSGWEGDTAEDVLYFVARYLDQEVEDV